MVENELARRKAQLGSFIPTQETQINPLKDKIQTNEEIDEFIGVTNDSLKTKKLDFETDINED